MPVLARFRKNGQHGVVHEPQRSTLCNFFAGVEETLKFVSIQTPWSPKKVNLLGIIKAIGRRVKHSLLNQLLKIDSKIFRQFSDFR